MIRSISLKSLLLSLYLALGGVVWFYNYSLGLLKLLILILLIISCRRYFTSINRLYGLKYFVLFFLITILTLWLNNSDVALLFLWGVIENYIFFVIGYNYAKDNLIYRQLVVSIIVIIGVVCVFTVTNYVFNVPDWVSPIELTRIEKMNELSGGMFETSKLYQTGFGLARTGWGNSIAPFIPLSFIFIKYSKNKLLSIGMALSIFFSISFCASRGALLVVFIVLLLLSYKLRHKPIFKYFLIMFPFLLIILCMLFISYGEVLMYYYRITPGNDITTGRSEQYSYIYQMIERMGFWGLGINGTYNFLKNVGLPFNIHNAYINVFLQMGWVLGFCFFTLVFKIIYYIQYEFKKTNDFNRVCICLILISGLISSLFEPMGVWGTRSWYSIWWFILGTFWYSKTVSLSLIKK